MTTTVDTDVSVPVSSDAPQSMGPVTHPSQWAYSTRSITAGSLKMLLASVRLFGHGNYTMVGNMRTVGQCSHTLSHMSRARQLHLQSICNPSAIHLQKLQLQLLCCCWTKHE